MANEEGDDNRSQFFITMEPAEELNRRNTIFGKVSRGFLHMDDPNE